MTILVISTIELHPLMLDKGLQIDLELFGIIIPIFAVYVLVCESNFKMFIGSEAGTKVERILFGATEICTSSIVLAEIARKYFREVFNEVDVSWRIQVYKGPFNNCRYRF